MEQVHPVISPNSLLVMCSSKGRPHRLVEMLNSFQDTKTLPTTKLMIYVSENDDRLNEYKPILKRMSEFYPDIGYEIGPYKYMIEVLNYFSTEVFPELPYYSEVNDDHIFRTVGWDEKMTEAISKKNGWAICYGWTQNLPTAIMMGGKLVKAWGYFLSPFFTHLHVDNHIKELGEALDLWVHLPDVVIEHMHPMFGKSNRDSTYEWVFSGEQFSDGEKRLKLWQDQHKGIDIQKIREAMLEESKQEG